MKILRDIGAVAKPTQLCALLPFYSGHDEESFRLSSLGRWYGRLLALGHLITSVLIGKDVLFSSGEYRLVASAQGDTEEINRTIETLLCIGSYTMMALSSVQNATRHCRILRDIAKIDRYLEANGFRMTYHCRMLGVMLSSLALGVLGVAFNYIHFQSGIAGWRQFHLLLIYSLQLLYSTVFTLYLRTIFKSLAQRIAFLNRRLDAFALRESQNGFDDRESWRELSTMIELLCEFRYITENMNSVAGVALLFVFGFSFYTVTNQSYLAFATLTAVSSEDRGTIGLSCAWVLAETITIAVICSACDCLASEANTSAQILARVYGKSQQFQNIIDKFLTKSIKQDLQFTAYGFFSIDNSTLFKIFSAVTTYLVILIQFKELEDSKMDEANQLG